MTKYILSMNTKGGTGKSMTAVNLANMLSKKYKVGIADCDIDSSNIPDMLGIKTRVKLDANDRNFIPEIWNGIKVMGTGLLYQGIMTMFKTGDENRQIIADILKATNWGDLDYMVIDSPAGSSDELRAITDIVGEENIVGVVLVATPKNVEDCVRVYNICSMVGLKIIGVIENMAGVVCKKCWTVAKCPQCGEPIDPFGHNNGGVGNFAKAYDVRFLGSIPLFNMEKNSVLLPDELNGPILDAVMLITEG